MDELSGQTTSEVASRASARPGDIWQPTIPEPISLATTYDRLTYLWSVHSFTNECIRFSDTKAGAVVVIATGLIGALYGSEIHRRSTLLPVAPSDPKAWAALSAFILLILGVLCGAWSIIPRLQKCRERNFIFWDNVLEFRSAADYAKALRAESFEGLLDHLASELFIVASICRIKYRWLRLSISLALLGGLIGGGVFVL